MVQLQVDRLPSRGVKDESMIDSALPSQPQPGVPPRCPHLGLRRDPSSLSLIPTPEHRCHVGRRPRFIDSKRQAAVCLTNDFGRCPLLMAHAAPPSSRRPLVGRLGTARVWAVPAGITLGLVILLIVIQPGLRGYLPDPDVKTASSTVVAGAPEPIATAVRTATPAAPTVAPAVATLAPVVPTAAAPSVPRAMATVGPELRTTVSPIPPPPTVDPVVPPATLATVLDEGFDEAEPRGWPHRPDSMAWQADGAYHLFARSPGHFVAVGAPIAGSLRDAVVRGTFHKVGGPDGGGYGLILRDQQTATRNGLTQAGHFLVLEVGDRGEFGIWRRNGDHWVELVPWTRSNAVHMGSAQNQLEARAHGPQITFIVNGVRVAEVTDSSPAAGGVGVFAGGDRNQVVLEAFSVEASSGDIAGGQGDGLTLTE
jgi:hypothetical protein